MVRASGWTDATCVICGADFRAKIWYVVRGQGRFCSQPCKKAFRIPLEVRFWAKVQKTDGCWLWIAARDQDGYGIIDQRGKAHRLSYEWANGPIPPGLWVLHHCDNPPCVRPDHLFLGNAKTNAADCKAKGRTSRLGGPILRGEASPTAKLTETAVREMRSMYASGEYVQKQLALRFGVSESLVWLVVHRQKWKQVA